MNIGMVLQGKFPPDIRIEKEARALIKAGHKIYLLARSYSGREKEEIVDGILVRSIYMQRNRIKELIDNVVFAFTFKNKCWAAEIERFVKDFNINVIHVHDLPLVGIGTMVGRKHEIPVVADLHENYPVALHVWQAKKKWWFNIVNNYKRWSDYEKKILKKVNQIIVVVEEARERLITEGLPPEKITIVGNTEEVHTFTGQKIHDDIINRYMGQFVISYAGGFGPHRGIDCAIRAMLGVKEHIPTAKLLLIGGKGSYEKEMKQLVLSLDLTKNVEVLGWEPSDKVATYIKLSDVCLVPHHKNDHTDTTIPHKLFQYMLMEKPVIVSDCRPLKRIVEETGCGLVFESGNEKDMSEKIIMLWKNQSLRKAYGKKGKLAVLNKYNWQNSSRDLCNLYNKIKQYDS